MHGYPPAMHRDSILDPADPRWRPHSLLLACALLLLALLSPLARAQQIEARTILERERVPVGLPTQMVVEISGALRSSVPQLPEIPDLEMRFVRAVQDHAPVVVINNERQFTRPDRFRLVYEVTPLREGEFEVPSLEVTVEGQTYRTAPVTLLAVQPAEDQRFVLRLELDAEQAWVGQPVRLRLLWAARDTAEPRSIEGEIPESFQTFTPQDASWRAGMSPFTIRYRGQRAEAGVRRHRDAEGELSDVLALEQILVPLDAGDLRIGPFSLVFHVVDAFARDRWGRAQNDRRVSVAAPITLRVRPLPTGGRPEGFAGAVGPVALEAAADRTEVRVGDPIELTLRIRADEPIRRIGPPVLEALANLSESFRLDPDGWEHVQTTPTEREYRTTIRARDEQVAAIPPIELPWFDPDRGEYVVARTGEIPLRVQATPGVEISTAERSPSPLVVEPGTPEPLVDRHSGVLANEHGPDLLVRETVDPAALLRSPLGLALLVGPPAAWALAAGALALRRRRRSPGYRRRHALARARRVLRARAEPDERISRAIRIYVGETFGRPPRAITEHDCRRLLADSGLGDAGGELAWMLTSAQRPRYAGDDRHEKLSPGGVATLLRRVDRELKRKGAK